MNFFLIFHLKLVAPSIGLTLPNTSIVLINTQASWSCQFDARPEPTIKWYLDDVEVSNSRYSINTTVLGIFDNRTRVLTTLMINSTQPEDTGRIKCAAILPNGNITSSVDNIVYREYAHEFYLTMDLSLHRQVRFRLKFNACLNIL